MWVSHGVPGATRATDGGLEMGPKTPEMSRPACGTHRAPGRVMRLHSFLACIAVLIPVFACGGVTLSGPEPDDDGGTGSGTGSGADSGLATASVSLAVPLGLYTGCQVTTLSVGTQPGDAGGGFSAANGGAGTFTLAAGADGVLTGTLAFQQVSDGDLIGPAPVSGQVSFVPTSSKSAAFAPGRTSDIQAVGIDYEPATMSLQYEDTTVTVNATAGSLMLLGESLFVSLYGQTAADAGVEGSYAFSADVRCPVPDSLPASTFTGASLAAPFSAGVYGSCILDVGSFPDGFNSIGSAGSIALTENGGTVTATWTPGPGYDDAFGSFAFTATSGGTATLEAGQSYTVVQPCGPPPSMGVSSVPRTTPLTNIGGFLAVDGQSLFMNILGDTTSETCGAHYVSAICAARVKP